MGAELQKPLMMTHLGTLSCLADVKNQPERELVQKLLEEPGAFINGQNMTALDLAALPDDISKKDLRAVIKEQLDIEALDKKQLEKLNKTFKQAKSFLLHELHLQAPKEIQNQHAFKKWDEVEQFLARAKVFRESNKSNLAPYYCGMIKTMRAIWEFHKHSFENIQHEGEYFYDQLFQPDTDGMQFFHKTKHGTTEWDTLGIHTNDDGWINGVTASFRGKGDFRWFAKLIRKPELDADEVSDALGLRFEIKNERDAESIVPILVQFLAGKEVDKIIIENKNLLNANQAVELAEQLTSLSLNDCQTSFESDENPSSSSCYADLKLTGHIKIPEGGKDGAMHRSRPFEIQLVSVDNKNEKGFAHHAIYEAKQKLSVVSRLFGPFGERYFKRICAEASERTGMNAQKIEEHLLKTVLHKVAKNVQGSTVRFVTKDQFKRWSSSGFVSFEIDQH